MRAPAVGEARAEPGPEQRHEQRGAADPAAAARRQRRRGVVPKAPSQARSTSSGAGRDGIAGDGADRPRAARRAAPGRSAAARRAAAPRSCRRVCARLRAEQRLDASRPVARLAVGRGEDGGALRVGRRVGGGDEAARRAQLLGHCVERHPAVPLRRPDRPRRARRGRRAAGAARGRRAPSRCGRRGGRRRG